MNLCYISLFKEKVYHMNIQHITPNDDTIQIYFKDYMLCGATVAANLQRHLKIQIETNPYVYC